MASTCSPMASTCSPMASCTSFLYILVSIILIISNSTAQTPPAIVLPISKATSSFSPQYTTSINLRTHRIPAKLTVDLGGSNLWLTCSGGNFNTSMYRPVGCNTASCRLAAGGCEECHRRPAPRCHPKMCTVDVANRLTHHLLRSEVGLNAASLLFSGGGAASVPNLIFACGMDSILDGLAGGVVGMAGLGKGSPISLPSQIFSSFGLPKKFSICLSPSSNSDGVMIFGDKPYSFRPYSDVSVFLLYTPLILNPSQIHPSPEYFVNLTSIRVNGKDLNLNKTLLNINEYGTGGGGTKLSTINPYTVMHSSIYRVFKDAFVKELSRIPRVKAVPPFEVCYSSKSLPETPQVGPSAPFVDLVMHHKDVFWRIYGGNSLVRMNGGDVLCLGFVDGGENAEAALVIGGHQMENSFLQFDLENSRFGFTSTLLLQRTSCDNHS